MTSVRKWDTLIKSFKKRYTEKERKEILGSIIATYKNKTGEQVLENKFELALWLATQRSIV